MSADQVNLISNILKDLLKDDKSEEIAKLIVAKLKQQQEDKAEVKRKEQEERDKGINPYESCSGCYHPNMACKCDTKG